MITEIAGFEKIDYAASLIASGEIVAFPTETVYGLGGNAFNEEAIKKIFLAKGRPQDNPLIVHVADIDTIKIIAREIPPLAFSLWEAFSPGPLTLVLKKNEIIPNIVTAGYDTVAIRIPQNDIALELIKRSKLPIAAPSANRSGRVSPTTAKHVFDDLSGLIPLILDGGKSNVGIESTVLDLTKETPIILRPGFINAEMISLVVGNVINHKGEVIRAESPGMKYSHYMPKCPCIAATSSKNADKLYEQHPSSVIIASDIFLLGCRSENIISLGSTPEEAMSIIFSALRAAEKTYSYIIVEDFEYKKDYYALYNRLSKATSGLKY